MYKIILSIILFLVINGVAQPDPPNTEEAPCEDVPSDNPTDTVVSEIDPEGYVSIFDGTSLTGWWHSCFTSHSQGSPDGGRWQVDPDEQALYSMNRNGSIGSILMTKKKYDHYEIVFDFWPNYGNDGGIFHRTTFDGKCYQTVLDYIGGGSVGGSWGEAGWAGGDKRPFQYNSETDVNTGGNISWTEITSELDPTSYGCDQSGCDASDYNRLWDDNDWMTMKIAFYGGITNQTNIVHKSWFKKIDSEVWVPILHDSTQNRATPPSYVGFQIHAGGRFGSQGGNWYRNIKIRPLDEEGVPIIPAGVSGCMDPNYEEYNENATIDDPSACITLGIFDSPEAWSRNGVYFHQNLISVRIESKELFQISVQNMRGIIIDKIDFTGSGTYSPQGINKMPSGLYFLKVTRGQNSFVKKYFKK